VPAPYLAQGVEARPVRQIYVEQDGLRVLRFERRDARGDSPGLGGFVAPVAQRSGERKAYGRVVVDDQNLLFSLFQCAASRIVECRVECTLIIFQAAG